MNALLNLDPPFSPSYVPENEIRDDLGVSSLGTRKKLVRAIADLRQAQGTLVVLAVHLASIVSLDTTNLRLTSPPPSLPPSPRHRPHE